MSYKAACENNLPPIGKLENSWLRSSKADHGSRGAPEHLQVTEMVHYHSKMHTPAKRFKKLMIHATDTAACRTTCSRQSMLCWKKLELDKWPPSRLNVTEKLEASAWDWAAKVSLLRQHLPLEVSFLKKLSRLDWLIVQDSRIRNPFMAPTQSWYELMPMGSNPALPQHKVPMHIDTAGWTVSEDS